MSSLDPRPRPAGTIGKEGLVNGLQTGVAPLEWVLIKVQLLHVCGNNVFCTSSLKCNRSHSQHLTSVCALICWDSLCSDALLALFPGHRRNALTTSVSSNCYFPCQKVCSTNKISEHCHMTRVKPNCILHSNVADTPIPFQ